MAFFSVLLRRKKSDRQPDEDWENIVYDRDAVDFHDEEQRSRYVTNCIEQIAEATKEADLLQGEYSIVTAKLKDLEEFEALSESDKALLAGIAKQLIALEQECSKYHGKKNRMKDSDYQHMRKQEDEVLEGIRKLKECESYGELVRQDLQKLDRERNAYEYRKMELDTTLNNFRGMAVIFFTAFALCIGLMAILHFAFEMETKVGILLSVGAVAVAATVLSVKFTDREKELGKVENTLHKLIQLQNKVKIRYVNNKNLQEYLRIKYNADSSAILEKQWNLYQQEREERKVFAEAEARIELYQERLIDQMKRFHISDPVCWIHQPGAIIDKRELVEIRHDLILRRQALRKQMDYNNGVAKTARDEIMDIVQKYPVYGPEILAMVDKYDGES